MNLLVSKKNRVLHIGLNRPAKRNALTLEMCNGIVTAVKEVQDASDVGAIIIYAVGSVFCAGMDLDESTELDQSALAAAHEELFSIGFASMKPILVAVSGAALGGGLGLVAQGHVVFAAEGAVFALSEIKVGLWPFMVYRAMSAAIGGRRTLELSLTGHSFAAHQACEWGLVHRICPAPELKDRTHALAHQIARASPLAVASGMKYVREAAGKSWQEAGELAASLREHLMGSADFREGALAFKQRREAHWPSLAPDVHSDNGNVMAPAGDSGLR